MGHYIYSTLTAGVAYTEWHKTENDLHKKGRVVNIRGGANLADVERARYTPRGVVTEVSDEEMEFLKTHPTFKKHVENGFITYEPREIKVDKAIENMVKEDKSAPETDESLKKKKMSKRMENPI